MPPKERSAVINIKPEDLSLQCEWKDCSHVFNSMDAFTPHVTGHLMEHINYTGEEKPMTDLEDKHCHWQECNVEIDGDTADYLRHVYYHTFHVKIKCIGALLLEKTGRRPCLYDAGNRNLIPDLPECLECRWNMCHARFENAEMFYQHVQSHADCYPDGNAVKNGCKCQWEGCDVSVKSKHKLKDHFKSHTQEKKVACPTCGALFSCRTKFFDHLSRQPGYNTGKQYQCSHCNSMFGAERLLREHMRYHVNQFKCPFCEMSAPSPSNMRLHIKYRHSDEKPFKCPTCDYRCKSVQDLKKHIDKHSGDSMLVCEFPNCNYQTKNFRSLDHHFSRVHQRMDMSVYQCHVCESSFSRGALLTKHLKTKHKFNWPAGHSRFRYKRHSDGKWRLQTVRYESVEMTNSIEPPSVSSSNTSQSDDVLDMPSFSESNPSGTNGIILVEKLDTSNTSDSKGNQNNVCLVSVLDNSGKKKTQHVVATTDDDTECDLDENYTIEVNSDIENNDCTKGDKSELSYDITVNTENESGNCEVDDAIEIRIFENQNGEYIMQTKDAETGELEEMDTNTPVDMKNEMNFHEETMYNLQMLGDVALKGTKK